MEIHKYGNMDKKKGVSRQDICRLAGSIARERGLTGRLDTAIIYGRLLAIVRRLDGMQTVGIGSR